MTEPTDRERALIEAYWKLRDHAESLRDTEVYRRARRAVEEGGENPDHRAVLRYSVQHWNGRGIERAAGLIADMLGVEEHEIERLGEHPHVG